MNPKRPHPPSPTTTTLTPPSTLARFADTKEHTSQIPLHTSYSQIPVGKFENRDDTG